MGGRGVSTTLTEYILAYERPRGGKVARYGTVRFTFPALLPGQIVRFSLLPIYGTYCTIIFWNRMSPSIVPDTIFFDWQHSGVVYAAGLISSLVFAEGANLWVEVRRDDPVHINGYNASTVAQYYQQVISCLLVQTEDDLKIVHRLVNEYGHGGGIT